MTSSVSTVKPHQMRSPGRAVAIAADVEGDALLLQQSRGGVRRSRPGRRPESAVISGSHHAFRQTEVLERDAGSAEARKSILRGLRRPVFQHLQIAVGAAAQFRKAANRSRPLQRVEVVLDAEHRGRVDGRRFEDFGVELVALLQAEDLRHRPGRIVAFDPRHGAGRQDQHAVRGLAAQGLLPGEGHHIELGPIERLGEAGAGGVADGQALAVRGR